MHKVSYMLAKRFSQDPLETCFCKQNPCGAWKDNLPLYDFGYVNTFRNQKVFKPIATVNVRVKKTNFESDITTPTVLFNFSGLCILGPDTLWKLGDKTAWVAHGTIIQTGISSKKIPCYIRDSACRWFIVKKAKIFRSYVKHFWVLTGVRKYRILIGLCK